MQKMSCILLLLNIYKNTQYLLRKEFIKTKYWHRKISRIPEIEHTILFQQYSIILK